MLAHKEPRQLSLLLSVLRHPQVRVYLHLDSRVALKQFSRGLSYQDVDHVVWLPRHPTRWGGIEYVDAALTGLARGIADDCDYFILISGQDFPLLSPEAILEFLERAPDRSYMSHFPLPTPRWRFQGRDRTEFHTFNVLGRRETCIPRGEDVSFLNWKGRLLNEILRLRTAFHGPRRFPAYARPFGGWSWWNLSRAAVEYTLAFVDRHPDYRAYHRHTLSADEIFFQSILMGTDFVGREAVVDDALRFVVWPRGSSHPRTLLTDDLPAMTESQALFARKFDAQIDHAVLAELANRVREDG